MNRGITAVGLCMLCGLLLTVISAQGANAAGTTGYTCKEVNAGFEFTDVHCEDKGAFGPFGHESINGDTTTEVAVNNEGVMSLKATIGGISTEFVAQTFSGSGWMENKEEGGEMYATGEVTTTYTNVTIASPVGKGCKVSTDNGGIAGEEGLVHTNTLRVTTKGQGDSLKFEPGEGAGERLATFIVSGCSGSAALEALNKTYFVSGSVKGVATGAKVGFTHAETTTQNTLKLNGAIKAGLAGALTLRSRADSTEPYRRMSATT